MTRLVKLDFRFDREGENLMCDYRKATIELIENVYDKAISLKKREWDNLKNDVGLGKKKIYLFGCGILGKSLYNMFVEDGYTIEAFVDNDFQNWGKIVLDDKKCISPQELYSLDNPVVFITIGKAHEVYRQLLENSEIKEIYRYPMAYFSIQHNNHMEYTKDELIDNILHLFSILEDEYSKKIVYWQVKSWFASREELNQMNWNELYSDDIYIPRDLFTFGDHEIVIDCGAYNGDTFRYLYEKGVKWDCYHAFEMSKKNYIEFGSINDNMPIDVVSKLKLYPYGVGEKKEKIYYSENWSGSHRSEESDKMKEAWIVRLDDIITDNITYIKMDIEGSEMSALRGARETIENTQPKCAICAYHKPSDLWEIPLYLKEIVPEYHICLKHHDYITSDTVCYAMKV